jgi:hypothetical protein
MPAGFLRNFAFLAKNLRKDFVIFGVFDGVANPADLKG